MASPSRRSTEDLDYSVDQTASNPGSVVPTRKLYTGIDLERLPTEYVVDGEKIKSHGNVYQYKLLTMYACKGLATAQFRLGCELQDAGGFDDIVYQYDVGDGIVFDMLQLKHFSKADSTLLTHRDFFMHKRGPFMLDRYFSTFRNRLNDSFEDTYKGRLEEIALVTNADLKYTPAMPEQTFNECLQDGHRVYKFDARQRDRNIRNMICAGSEHELKNREFLNRMSCLLSMFFDGEKLKPDADRFFDLLRIHVDVSFEHVEATTRTILGRYLRVEEHMETVYKRLYDRIADWVMRPTGTFLRKSDWIAWIEEIEKTIPNKLTAYHDLQVKHLRAYDIRFVGDGFEKISSSLRTRAILVNVVARCDVTISALRVMRSLESRYSVITGSQFVLYPKRDLLNDMRLCWSLYLIVMCEESLENVHGASVDFLETNSERIRGEKIIVITKTPLDRQGYEMFEDCVAFVDVDEGTQKRILERTVMFRGSLTSVESVVFDGARQTIRDEILYDLIVSPDIRIGKLFVSEQERRRNVEEQTCYIERRLRSCTAIRSEVFRKEHVDDVLVLSNIGEKEFGVLYTELVAFESAAATRDTFFADSSDGHGMRMFDRMCEERRSVLCGTGVPDELFGKRFVVMRTDDPEREFEQICAQFRAKNVSWLEHDGTGNFSWKRTRGSVRNLRQYVDGDVSKSVNVDRLTSVDGNVVLITGAPGMGKSALLSHLLLESVDREPGVWVVKIDLVAHTKTFSDETFETDRPFDFLLATQRFESDFERILFEEYFNGNRTAVLFDGFDEIAPSHRRVVTELIRKLIQTSKCTVWVTTRPQEQKHVEDSLGVFAYTLAPFDDDDRKSFFLKRWHERVSDVARSTLFVEQLMDVIDGSVRGIDTFLLAVPLQCKMFAEIFEVKLVEFCNSDATRPDLPRVVDVLELYDRFIEKKCDIYVREKKTGIESTVDASKKIIRLFRKCVLETHRLLGLRLLFDDDVLDALLTDDERDAVETALGEIESGDEKTGIVESVADGRPMFVHRNVAEYCAALWFHGRAGGPDGAPVRAFVAAKLFDAEHENLKRFFDLLAVKQAPALASLLRGDAEAVAGLLDSEGDEFFETVDRFGRNALHLIATYPHDNVSAKVINAAGPYVTKRDRFLEWSPLRYACTSAVWSNVDVLLTKSDESFVDFVADRTDLLFRAAERGYTAVVRRLVAETEPSETSRLVNARNAARQTPVHLAAPFGHLEICESLLDAGAEIDARDDSDSSFLHYVGIVPRADIVDVVRCLSKRGALVDAVNSRGSTPLHFAVQYGCPRVCEVFIKECGADVNASDGKSMNALHYAVSASAENRLEIVRGLVEAGVRLDDVNSEGMTALHLAARFGHEDICRYLILDAGVDVKVRDKRGDSVLHHLAYSTRQNRAEIVSVLIQTGVDVDAPNNDLTTPLHLAVMHADRDVCTTLLREGNADVNAVNRADAGVLHHVVDNPKEDRLEIVRDLIEAGARVDAVDGDGNTPLLYSVLKGNVKLCRYFLTETDADVRARNKTGANILHYLASSGKPDRVEIAADLIRAGADVNGRDVHGTTPLHLAIMCADLNLCAYLITETEADLNALNDSLVGVLHAVAFRTRDGGAEVARLLVDAGAPVDVRNEDGATPLHLVAKCGRPEVCRYLTTETSTDVGARDDERRTAMHYAAMSAIGGRNAIVRQLMVSGVDVDAVDANGATALMTALTHGNKDVCTYLIRIGADVHATDATGAGVWHYLANGGLDEHDLIEIGELLRASVPVDCVDANGESPLVAAARLGRFVVYEYLVATAEFQAGGFYVDSDRQRTVD